MKTTGILAAAALATAGGALAQSPPVKSPASKDGEKICRIEDRTGSWFTQKVCRTRSEWIAIDSGNSSDTERVFRLRRGIAGKMITAD